MTKNVMEKIHNELVSGIKKGEMKTVLDVATREDVKDSSDDVGSSGTSHLEKNPVAAGQTTENGSDIPNMRPTRNETYWRQGHV